MAERISFRIFLGTTEVIPDFSTVWLIARAGIKFMMNSIVYNLVQLKYLASIQST